MHTLKKKLRHELEKIEHEEMARSGELTHETVDLAYKLAKTYYYLCMIGKDNMELHDMKDGHAGKYEVEVKDRKSMLD